MAKAPTPTQQLVRDPKSERTVAVRGVGALKGRLIIEKGVDLPKPIASQVLKDSKTREVALASPG